MNPDKLRQLRHIDLPQLGFAGVEKIAAGSVLLVGLGGLGAPAALYLAAAGVGRLGLVDDDVVEVSNLQRQVIYTEADQGRPKVEAAAARLQALNSTVKLEPHATRLTEANAATLVRDYAVVLDGSDNFPTRLLLNRICHSLRKPLVTAAVQGFAGQITTYKSWLPHAPCYACLFPQEPPEGMVPTCPEAGVFGPTVGMFGTLQAAEALKELAGLGSASTRLFAFDALTGNTQTMTVSHDPECPVCGIASSEASYKNKTSSRA